MKLNEIIEKVANGMQVIGLDEKVSDKDIWESEDAYAFTDSESPYGIDIRITGFKYELGDDADENGEPLNLYPVPTRWVCIIDFDPERYSAIHETPGKAFAAAISGIRESDLLEFGEEYFFGAIQRTKFKSYGYSC